MCAANNDRSIMSSSHSQGKVSCECLSVRMLSSAGQQYHYTQVKYNGVSVSRYIQMLYSAAQQGWYASRSAAVEKVMALRSSFAWLFSSFMFMQSSTNYADVTIEWLALYTTNIC